MISIALCLLLIQPYSAFIRSNQYLNSRRTLTGLAVAPAASAPPTAGPVLPIEEVAARWKVVKFGQGGYNAIECNDRDFCYQTFSFTLKRTGGLGLDLLEYNVGKADIGLVVVGDIIAGSNAAACGGFQVGDALSEISSVSPSNPGEEPLVTRLEGLNFDETVRLLGLYSEYDTVSITVKRMALRGAVTVVMVGPDGRDAGSFKVLSGYGSNMRTALQANNMKLYDDRTARFDSPYQTGNCGGDGTCGTCVVAVLQVLYGSKGWC